MAEPIGSPFALRDWPTHEEWIEQQRTRWERLFDVVGEYLEERKEGDDRAR